MMPHTVERYMSGETDELGFGLEPAAPLAARANEAIHSSVA